MKPIFLPIRINSSWFYRPAIGIQIESSVVAIGDIFRDRVLETKVRASAVQHEIDAGRIISGRKSMTINRAVV